MAKYRESVNYLMNIVSEVSTSDADRARAIKAYEDAVLREKMNEGQ